jgi:hypothetical protein
MRLLAHLNSWLGTVCRHLRIKLAVTLVFLLLFAGTVVLQYIGGAYESEFGSDADEPAHYVTGLMVRDYIAQGGSTDPLTYAQEYYRHYPKVALGHWPPLFYVVQSMWTLLFSPSRTSILLLMAVMTALLATVLAEALQAEFSLSAGVTAGLLLISLPLIQQLARAVMAEILVALLALLATLSFGKYLDTPNRSDALRFGVWSALCILTKGTGFVLALVPLFGILLTRRWCLVKTWTFWLPLLIVLLFCCPWYALVPGAANERVARFGGIYLSVSDLLSTPAHWLHAVGPALLPLSILGIMSRAGRVVFRKDRQGQWVAAASFLAALATFQCLIAAARVSRAMTLAEPALMMFVVAGASCVLASPWLRVRATTRVLAPAIAAFILFSVHVAITPRKPRFGYVNLVHELLSYPTLRDSVFMICSDASGEGMFIAEIAMHERRPGHIVLRATKALAITDWMGSSYRLRYKSPDEVMRFFYEASVRVLVVDISAARSFDHNRLVIQTLESYRDRWKPLFPRPYNASGGQSSQVFLVYQLER